MGVWLKDLPAALAGWGFQTTEVAGWQTRGYGPLLRSPRGVVCHWTATPYRATNAFPTTNLVVNGRGAPNPLPGPLANLMLGFDGQPKIIAAGLANHAGTGNRGVPFSGNSDSIGIECEGAGTWTAAQLEAYPRLCAALWHWYADVKLTNVVSHQEWTSRKIDIHTWPGGMGAFRQAVQAATKGDDFLMGLRQEDQNLVAESAGTIDRALDTKFRSKVILEDGSQSTYEGYATDFILNTNADGYYTRKTTEKLLAEQVETNRLLRLLVDQGKTA